MRGLTLEKRVCGLVVCLVAAVRAAAQWYAPATEFHDPVQRVFPVEFARLLAWRENLAGAKIQEVAYEVAPATDDGKTTWVLRWIGEGGATWREQRIEYGAELLRAGPGFYREVRRQFFAEPWAAAKTGTVLSGDDFWLGADARTVSRLAGFRHAMQLAPELQQEPDGAVRGRLAGRLLAAALPGVTGLVTLDSTLTARGAGWLALAEGVEAHGAAADRRWAPVLWLSRRERAAQALWAAAEEAESAAASPAATARAWWNDLLAARPANDVFLSAAKHRALARQVPLLAYGARLKDRADLLGGGLREVCRDDAALLACYDHAYWIWRDGTLSDGQLTGGRWAVEARRDWLATLVECFPAGGAAPKANPHVTIIDDGRNEFGDSSDPAVEGFTEVARELGRGPSRKNTVLRPVAIATEADLRDHGTEIVGLTLAGRYAFLETKFGPGDATEDFITFVHSRFRSIGMFAAGRTFGRGTVVLSPQEAVRLGRIEHFGAQIARARSLPAGARDGDRLAGRDVTSGLSAAERARTLQRADWLLPDRVAAAMDRLAATMQPQLVLPLVERAHAEGGGLLDRRVAQEVLFAELGLAPAAPALELRRELTGERTMVFRAKQWLDRPAVAEQLLGDLPESDPLRREIWDQRHYADSLFERTRGYERLFWLEPVAADAPDIFERYLDACAFGAAKRFYDQFAPQAQDGGRFLRRAGAPRLVMALLEKDTAAAKTVQEALSAGGPGAELAEVLALVAAGDQAGTARAVDVFRERNPSGDPNNLLHDFLPLWPALATPGHPDRERALDYFAECEDWPELQWFFAMQCRLNLKDGIRFLGGDGAKGERRLMVACLQKDRDLFAETYDEIERGRSDRRWRPMAHVVVQYLRAKLFPRPAPADDVPPAAVPPRTLVQQLHDARS